MSGCSNCKGMTIDLGSAIDRALGRGQPIRIAGVQVAPPVFNSTQFTLGLTLIPGAVSLVTRVTAIPGFLPWGMAPSGIHPVVSRSILFVGSLVADVAASGTSFLFGATMGQFPGVMDAVGETLARAISKKISESRMVFEEPRKSSGIGERPEEFDVRERERREEGTQIGATEEDVEEVEALRRSLRASGADGRASVGATTHSDGSFAMGSTRDASSMALFGFSRQPDHVTFS